MSLIVDRTIGALVKGDTEAALAYAECQLKHAAVINAYIAARNTAITANAER